MSCGKRPLVKSWDGPRNLRVIKPSRYEQNEPSVKQHWRRVIKELELAHKDEKFWESSMETVRMLVGPVVFRRLAKIFDLPELPNEGYFTPATEGITTVPSVAFYKTEDANSGAQVNPLQSTSDVNLSMPSLANPEAEGQDSSDWSIDTSFSPDGSPVKRLSKISGIRVSSTSKKSVLRGSILRVKSAKVSARSLNRSFSRAMLSSDNESPHTGDDLQVHYGGLMISRVRRRGKVKNPHFDLLYCTESESDMIKWDSNLYERKKFFVSESDEFSKKAEILTKQIARDFYEWWIAFGTDDYKSEIKRPEDIEDLFQVWFDEHASRGLVLYPKIIPCVLKSIADFVGIRKKSCANVLRRQIAWDIRKETRPEHTKAFGRALPNKMKHVPPKNNTSMLWRGVKIPEDLRSMACVWADITHLTSTKAFHEWLTVRPHLPMPPCLKELNAPHVKQMLFQVPSDYVQRDRSSYSIKDLNLPVSQFEMEMKEVLDKLMD